MAASTLDRLTADERAEVLAALLAASPDLLAEAEGEARRLLDSVTVHAVAGAVAAALTYIPLEALGARAGRVRGRGYVHETDAAWELVTEAMDPFRVDLRRRAELGSSESAARMAVAIVAGLYQVREPEDGSVLAYAGLDCPGELAHEILDDATRLGLRILDEVLDPPIRRWLDLD